MTSQEELLKAMIDRALEHLESGSPAKVRAVLLNALSGNIEYPVPIVPYGPLQLVKK